MNFGGNYVHPHEVNPDAILNIVQMQAAYLLNGVNAQLLIHLLPGAFTTEKVITLYMYSTYVFSKRVIFFVSYLADLD